MTARPRSLLVTFLVLALAFAGLPAAAASAAECTPGEEGCLPDEQDCATGEHNGVTLGDTFMTAAVCVGAGGTTWLYAGGNANPTLLCGTVVVAGQALQETDPNQCADFGPMFPPRLRFRAIVPAGYAASKRSYPVLYLLAGGGHDERAWFGYDPSDPQLLSRLANRGVIIVSVFTGLTFHSDWRDGRGDWEADFLQRLVPAVDATLRTVPDRRARAIAGFSMGGSGAAMLSAHRPDLFSVVGSFSGALDLFSPGTFTTLWAGPTTGLGTYDEPIASPPQGQPMTNEVWWRDTNPADLVETYRNTSLWLSVGNGVPTPDDLAEFGPFTPVPAKTEIDLLASNLSFVDRLEAAGIDHTFRIHDGVHSNRAAAQDLRDWFPVMLAALGKARVPSFHLARAQPGFGAYGWTFRADSARAPEFLEATNVKRTGLSLTGSGLTTVTTARQFKPNQTVRVSGHRDAPQVLRANRAGRLTFRVDLGEPHELQQFTPQQRAAELAAAGSYWTTRTITFSKP